MNKTESTKPQTIYRPAPRPYKVAFYLNLKASTLPRYVWLKNNKNKYDGNGNLKTK